MGKWMNKWKTGAVILTVAALICGCGKSIPLMSRSKGEKEYGKAETMVIVTTERLRYEELYSDKIWTAAVDNRGTTFETVLLTQIHDFLKELKLMSLMASEEKISLSSREKELVKEAADAYMEALGTELAESFGLEKKDMEKLYMDYWMSEKLVENLTGDMNLEVSDSEAKVITVSQIELDDEATAQDVLAKVQAEGADFNSAAKEYSTDQESKKQIFKGLRGSEYEDTAYSLEQGQISEVISDGGKYYILKCVSDYDESATRIHKEQMMRDKKNQAFYGAYQSFKDGKELVGDEEAWTGLSITDSPKTTADFFKIYEEVCQGEGDYSPQ